MQYICFVGAPFELITIKEFITSRTIDDYKIYCIKSDNPKVNSQLYKTIKFDCRNYISC